MCARSQQAILVWQWLTEGQFTRLEELIVGLLMLLLGLFAEDWIDQWREGRRGK